MALTFKKPRLMTWNGTSITDHSRSPLAIEVERIEQSQRMTNGTLRKYHIADKRTFSCSWEMLPNTSAKTVDGFAGADAIRDFYNATPGAFTLVLYAGDGTTKTYSVVFTSFSAELTGRGNGDFWTISVTMEEV